MNRCEISPIERIISVLTYMTGGLIGIVWQLFCALKNKQMTKFLMFNVYQSIFLAIFLYLLFVLLGMAYNILVMIPYINVAVNFFTLLINSPILYGFSILHAIIFLTYLYLIIFSIMGRYAYLPWVSNIILYQIDRF